MTEAMLLLLGAGWAVGIAWLVRSWRQHRATLNRLKQDDCACGKVWRPLGVNCLHTQDGSARWHHGRAEQGGCWAQEL